RGVFSDLVLVAGEHLAGGGALRGRRGFDVGALATLVAPRDKPEVLAAVVSAFGRCLLNRRNQVVKMEVDGDVLEVSGLPSQERQLLTEEWLRRRTSDASSSTPTRSALIIASRSYQDPGLGQLRSPAHDAEALARGLGDP